MKKLLFLGGAKSQIIAISTAKEMGYYTILCDYLPDNPGRLIADEWYPASTTDYDAVMKVAIERKIDGILTYGSDVAASTAAYVAEKLGLPGSPYESVYTLTHKDKFRQFLRENGFNAPWSASFSECERQDAVDFIKSKSLPVMIKPVDSQGAKGITKICNYGEIDAAIDYALSKSICKRIIVEEYIERKGMQVGGDGFSVNGKIVFAPFSNTYFSDAKGMECIPVAECWPPISSQELLGRIQNELQRAISLLGMRTQAYNFEAMESKDGKVYILEIGPRNGGALVPIITEKMTGFDETRAIIKAASGDTIDCTAIKATGKYWASRCIGSKVTGFLDGFTLDKNFETQHLQVIEQYIDINNAIPEMQNLSNLIAYVGAKFDTFEEMTDFVKYPEKYVKVKMQQYE